METNVNASSNDPRQTVVLVADDDEHIRNLIATLLHDEGCLVLVASDGNAALELARHYPQQIHMLITDMQMPKLTGVELCARLINERPGIKILVISGDSMGANADIPFLSKPFGADLFVNRVKQILATPANV